VGSSVQCSGFKVGGLRFRVYDVGCGCEALGFLFGVRFKGSGIGSTRPSPHPPPSTPPPPAAAPPPPCIPPDGRASKVDGAAKVSGAAAGVIGPAAGPSGPAREREATKHNQFLRKRGVVQSARGGGGVRCPRDERCPFRCRAKSARPREREATKT